MICAKLILDLGAYIHADVDQLRLSFEALNHTLLEKVYVSIVEGVFITVFQAEVTSAEGRWTGELLEL